MDCQDKIQAALKIAWDNGKTDGAHHKMWVIDQMVRVLSGDSYEDFIGNYNFSRGEWDEGIAP